MKYDNPSILTWLKRRKRLVTYVASYVVVIGVQTVLYAGGMAAFESEPRSLIDSLGIVVQSHTTAGYGQDAPWDSGIMSLYVIMLQYTGVAYLFVAFPLFVVPWFKSVVLEPTVPDTIDDVDEHVILCGYSSLCSTLVDDLEARNQQYVIVEADGERARELYENDRTVIQGEMTDDETLRDIHLENARAVVVDSRDIEGINAVLTVREVDDDVPVLCLIDEPEDSQYLRYAGATTVISPKHRLGKSLADKAQSAGSDHLPVDEYDADIEIAEYPVTNDASVYDKSLTQLDKLDEIGANVLGAWIRGDFVSSFSEGDYLDENSVLVVAGTAEQLERVGELTGSHGRYPRAGPIVIAGHGTTGTTTEGILRKGGQSITVIDIEGDEGVDIVGDATETETLNEAGVQDAATVILTLPDDDTAILATLVANGINPDAEIIVAASDAANTNKLYSAGADFVLALPKLAGRMAALELFEEEVMTLPEQAQLERLDGSELDAKLPENDQLRESTDAVVVGIRRDGETLTEFDDVEIHDDDTIIVGGTDDGIDEFADTFTA